MADELLERIGSAKPKAPELTSDVGKGASSSDTTPSSDTDAHTLVATAVMTQGVVTVASANWLSAR